MSWFDLQTFARLHTCLKL
jgi:hypothetical protein